MLTRKSIAATAAAALTAGIVVPTALAQNPTETPAAEQETTREERHAAHRTEFAAGVAEELGMDADTVAAAIEKVQTAMAERHAAEHRARLEERLDAAVEDGSLTRDQADAILAAQDAGVFRGFGGRGGPGGHRGFRSGPGGPSPAASA